MSSQQSIGLGRGTVKLVAHDPRWVEYFRKEKELLSKLLGEKVVDICHVGGTAIAGVLAKPILDILAGVEALSEVDAFTEKLARIGYEDKGDGGATERRFFVKGSELSRTHHLTFCEMNSFFWRSHVAFCEYLRRHPETAKEYSLLKSGLAKRFSNDRGAYTAGKEKFVRTVTERALNESH